MLKVKCNLKNRHLKSFKEGTDWIMISLKNAFILYLFGWEIYRLGKVFLKGGNCR